MKLYSKDYYQRQKVINELAQKIVKRKKISEYKKRNLIITEFAKLVKLWQLCHKWTL